MSVRSAISRVLILFGLGLIIFVATGCSSTRIQKRPHAHSTASSSHVGLASYYAKKFHGKRTASGERYSMQKMTAAHRSLSFGTNVKVTHLDNGRSVIVRINDRGPFVRNRSIDVSLAAARELGMLKAGVARVKVEVLSGSQTKLVSQEK